MQYPARLAAATSKWGVRAFSPDAGVWPFCVPEGRGENSPALQCRECSIRAMRSPVGTTDRASTGRRTISDGSAVPTGLVPVRRRNPGTEVPGYSRCVPMGRSPVSVLSTSQAGSCRTRSGNKSLALAREDELA